MSDSQRRRTNQKKREWNRNNKHKRDLYKDRRKDYYRSLTRFYQARKVNATPPWVGKKERGEIEEYYKHARDCELITGERYEVDHIVPLKGITICGLHVPWNLQVLPAGVNRSKKNKFDGWGIGHGVLSR